MVYNFSIFSAFDKKFVLEKEKAAQVKLEKMAKLKALRLAKEASESAWG